LSYEQLSTLPQLFPKGFQVLAFPTNDYHQELSTNDEIQEYVNENFPNATFPVFGLSSLEENPVYQALQRQRPEYQVRHNFYKYLIDPNGMIIGFYDKKTEPFDIIPDIKKVLKFKNNNNDDDDTIIHQKLVIE